MLTLKEEMALAVLRGDDAAAEALADRIIEEKIGMIQKEGIPQTQKVYKLQPSGYEVYHWPEFQALLKRLNIDYTARTVSIAFKLAADEPVVIEHIVHGEDKSS